MLKKSLIYAAHTIMCSRAEIEVQKLRLPHLEALSHRGNPPPCTLGCTGVGVSVSSCLPSCLVTLKFPRSMTHHRLQRLAVGNQSVLKSEIIGFTMYQFKILKSPIHCYVPKALATFTDYYAGYPTLACLYRIFCQCDQVLLYSIYWRKNSKHLDFHQSPSRHLLLLQRDKIKTVNKPDSNRSFCGRL